MLYLGLMVGATIGTVLWKIITDAVKWNWVEKITWQDVFFRSYFMCGGIIICWFAR